MYFTKSDRDALTQSKEHVAASTMRPDTVRRPLPKRSLPAVHHSDHSTQESAEDIKPDGKTASKQEYDAISPTPAGLESQDLVGQPKPGHWNEDGQGRIHLGSFRFPHPHFSNRLSLDDPDGLLSEVISRGGTHDTGAASGQDDLMLRADRVEGAAPLQRRYSISSSGGDRADDQQGFETHPSFLAKRPLPKLEAQPLVMDRSL
jgi:hypothetical protein